MDDILQYDLTSIRGALATCFILLINSLFSRVVSIGKTNIYPEDQATNLLEEANPVFDFVIVGGGAAGCTLAMLLTNTTAWNVLLIEAGGYPPASSEVPAFFNTFKLTNNDWQFQVEEDPKACRAMVGKKCTINRGRVLGGTSTISNMHYVRPLANDLDKTYIPYWNSNLTRRLFEHMEYSQPPKKHYQFEYGRKGGLILTVFATAVEPVKNIVKKFYNNLGYLSIPRRKELGFIKHFVYSRGAERYNMAKMFLAPVKDRPNLFVTYNSKATGVVIGEIHDKRAQGVNVTISNCNFTIRAKKEVILTAGAINNAQLLMVSGVGPMDYLQKKKIPMKAHLPEVGKNLQLHLNLPMFFAINECFNRTDACQNVFSMTDFLADTFHYIMNRTGGLATTGLNSFAIYISTEKTGKIIPNLGIFHNYYKIEDRLFEPMLKGLNLKPEVKKSLMFYNQKFAILEFNVMLLQPQSRGEVLLNTSDIFGKPTIVPKFLSDKENSDYDKMSKGFKFVSNISKQSYAKQRDFTFLELDLKDCKSYDVGSIGYVKCYINNMAYPLSDVAGTTKMGAKCDEDSVLNHLLEVKGVRCLRVADSSVLPFITSGNSVATDAMIGYRVGEIIRQKWLKNYISEFAYNITEYAELVEETML